MSGIEKGFKFFFWIVFSGCLLSCIPSLPRQYRDSSLSKKNQVFSLEDIQKARCQLSTGNVLQENSISSRAKKFIIEPNQLQSLVFRGAKETPSVINNFPFVEYSVQGPALCRVLLSQRQIKLSARPFFIYPVRFQIKGSYLRILIEGFYYDLPYQKLTSAVYKRSDYYAVPIGGYRIQQGRVRSVKNVENRETHILDFFPIDNQPFEAVSVKGGPLKHWVRKGAESIWIYELDRGFAGYQYKDKKDIFPKSYFEGVWYSGVSVVSSEPLLGRSSRGMIHLISSSGMNVSGDSFSGLTDGQKIYFQFESDYLRAVNESYSRQSRQLKAKQPAEAEVLSFPIQHHDYESVSEEDLIGSGLEEASASDLSWKDKRYVEVDFSRVDHYFSKRVRQLISRYGDVFNFQLKTNSITVKEIRFAHNYFDVVVYDGYLEYRFSFLRYSPDPSYKPRSLAESDRRFEYFYVPDRRAFYEAEDSFKSDYEDNILLLRVHPNKQNQIVLHFSNLTSKDEKIRSIGRSAVSLWNQALKKAGLSLTLYIDERKDVNVGDIRYHVLNLGDLSSRAVLGAAQAYVDENTGQKISTASNVFFDSIIESLKESIIYYAYKKYGLLGKSISSPFVQKDSGLNLSFSSSSLNYVLFHNKISQLESLPAFGLMRSEEEAAQYRNSFKLLSRDILNSSFDVFSLKNSFLEGGLFNDWIRKFKFVYALKTRRFIEDESLPDVQNQINSWVLEKWEDSQNHFKEDHIFEVISQACPFLSHPEEQREKFKQNVIRCADQIYPIYALGTTVHEIGHSIFSLMHNFAGSVDRENFYPEDAFQTRRLNPYLSYKDSRGKTRLLTRHFPAVSSSVMDYISISHGEQWAPGPYDAAAVQYLYGESSQEEASQSFSNHNFARCSDWSQGSSSSCLKWDIGAAPEEQVMKEIQSLLHLINYSSYNFDRRLKPVQHIYMKLQRIMTFYYEWRKRLSVFISQRRESGPGQMSEDQYQQILAEIVERGKSESASFEEKERLSFYRVRNLIYHALSYIAFTPNRYCILKRNGIPETAVRYNVRTLVELSKVLKYHRSKTSYLNEDVFSCWADDQKTTPHPIVQDYIQSHYPQFTLEDEKGHFLYPYLTAQNQYYQGLDPNYYRRYDGTFLIRLSVFSALSLTEFYFPNPKSLVYFGEHPITMMNERDIESGVERLILARMTRGVFFPQMDDFIKSLENVSLEELTPEHSAFLLFNFPNKRGDEDLIFRDELIQPNKLLKAAQKPHQRDDQHEVQFFQNFEEEMELVRRMSFLYQNGRIIAGGNNSASISERGESLHQDMFVDYSFTGNLLLNKALKYLDHQENPDGAASYYFDFKDLYAAPLESQEALDGIGNLVISELAKNSIYNLWSDSHLNLFQTPSQKASGDFEKNGFTSVLLNFLQTMLKLQGTRLGRFYFIYTYTLALGFLEAYDHVLTNQYTDLDEVHSHAFQQLLPFVQNIQRLFFTQTCNVPKVFSRFYNSMMNLEQEGRINNGQNQHEILLDAQKGLKTLCPQDLYSKRGKLQVLYTNQMRLTNYRNSYLDRDISFAPDLEIFGLHRSRNIFQEYVENLKLSQSIQALNSSSYGITSMHFYFFVLFQKLFPFSMDREDMQNLLRIHRQLLIDIIPKLMLMYSGDRYFVGEMLWIAGGLYNSCMHRGNSSIVCPLQIERLASYYFSGVLYGNQMKLEQAFHDYMVGRRPLVDGGMSLQDLIHSNSVRVMDRFIVDSVFQPLVIEDYIFFERGWFPASVRLSEIQAQRELLFTLFPIISPKISNSSLFYRPLYRR